MPTPPLAARRTPSSPSRLGVAAALVAVLAGGCTSPLAVQGERDLRRSVLESVRRELSEAQQRPMMQVTAREPGVERLHISPELLPDLERMAGPQSYDRSAFPMGDDLLGQAQVRVPITLERAIRTAAMHNLEVEFARLQPAIAEAQVVAAQAAFDGTFFSNIDWANLDQGRTQTRQGAQVFGTPSDQRQTATSATGLRRPLTSGGQLTFQQDLNYSDLNSEGQSQSPNPAIDLAWTLRLDQPLLRNFGSDVALAQVRLSRNAERDAILRLKADLLRVVTETERAYWQLVQAQRDLLILQRLYERGIATRDEVINRFHVIGDVTTAQVADARARVERRAADVLRAQQTLRAASDALKIRMNDPELPIGGEVLLVPVDDALDAPVSFSLADVLITAIRSRPEMYQAILSIDNTSIRQQVADNARLPRLDLRLQTRIAGLQNDVGEAYEDLADRAFIDYLVGIQFEQPIGNRAAEANYRQRRLERMQATIAYRNTVQQIVLEVKRALRNVVTNYQLIEQTRVSRIAEAENLRSFEAESIVRARTPELLDLEFRRQEALAAAEQAEVGALIEYNAALAQLYAAMGTALEHNNILFEVPDADDALAAGGINAPESPVVPVGAETPLQAPAEPGLEWPWRRDRPR